MWTARPMDKGRAHSGAKRAFNVVSNAVADHQGLGGLNAQPLQRLGEDASMRLHEAVVGR